MRTQYLLPLCLLACLFSFGQQTPSPFDTALQRLGKQFMEDPLTRNLSVGIVYKGQSLHYAFHRDGTSPGGLFEIGSITKTFVSLVLAHAVTEGRVSLQDDIRKYLPSPLPNLTYNAHPIRLIHLANTSSALPDNLPAIPETVQHTVPDSIPFKKAALRAAVTASDFFAALAKAQPDTLPGTRPRHSNAAAWLLGYILEKVYGSSIDALVNKYVLQPLQMHNTSFAVSAASLPVMQGFDENNRPAPPIYGPFTTGIGAMRSTVDDMNKYLRYLLLQQDAPARTVLTPTIGIDAGTNKVIENNPRDTVNDRQYAISFNWLHYHPAPGELRIWQDGGTYGFRSYVIAFPEKELAMVFLSNRTGPAILDKMNAISSVLVSLAGK